MENINRNEAHKKLTQKNSSLFRMIIDNINDGVYFVDLDRRITLWNQAACDISGYSEREMIGRCCQDDLLNHVDQEGKPLCVVGCPLYHTMGDGQSRSAEVLLRHKDGYRLPISVRTHPVYSHGEIVGGLEIFSRKTPVTYDDELVESLTNRAMLDALTGLPNRAYVESFLEFKLSEAERFRRPFSVLAADVDDMEMFNRYYGRYAGDVMLQSMAESFRRSFTEQDIIGLWGNGMFVGVFRHHQPADVYSLVEYVRSLAAQSAVYYQDKQYLTRTVSVGLTLNRPGDTPFGLVSRAEALMVKSKNRGKNCSTLDVPMPEDYQRKRAT